MDQGPQTTRHEIMEERANRDAFRLCVLILLVVAIGLIVLGIAAWNSRFMLMPIVPREQPRTLNTFSTARQPGTPHQTAIRPWIAPSSTFTCRPVPSHAARGFRGSYLAKAMRPSLAAKAAGLQKIYA